MPTPLQQVEQNLAEIAVSQISEKNPNLLSHYLGFDIIDKNDDGTRAAGIMGFKIGGQLVYIPVFFLNGKVRGMEVMYLKNSDTFVANNEQWVNYISSQNPESMGEPAPKDQQRNDGETNNSLRIFSRPPASANSKAASVEDFSDLTVEQLIDSGIALSEPEHDLVDFLKAAGYETYRHFVEIATDHPSILKAASKFYDLEDLKIEFPEKAAKEEAQGKSESKVSLVSSDDILKNPSAHKGLGKEQKEKALRKGYTLKDVREETEKSDLYLGDYRKEFNQVTSSGYYEILNASGDLVKALVFSGINPVAERDEYRQGYAAQLVVDSSSGAAAWSKDPVFARDGAGEITNLTEEEKDRVVGKTGIPAKDASVNKTYILIDQDLVAYGPFTVDNKISEKGKTTLVVRQRYIPRADNSLMADGGNSDRLRDGCNQPCSPCDNKAYLRITDKEGGKPEFVGGACFLPKSVKAVEIHDNDCYKDGGKYEEDIAKITPGSPRVLDMAISSRGGDFVVLEKSATMVDFSVLHQGVSLSFRERGDVVLDLMKRANLSESAAEKLASAVFDDRASRAFGWTLPRSQKVAYPSMVVPQGAAGSNRDGTPVQTSQVERQEMIPASPGPERATNMGVGLWDQVTKEDLDFLERASDSNSRQVFDPAMIGTLVRTSRSQSIVQEYIPELVDNLDRMCRLLLLFYWHNQEFAEEYGIDEMADFEDLLLSTIKSTAKVVLFLKQRAVESSSGQTDVLG